MEGETLESSLWFVTLFQRHRGILERAAREGLIVCVPQTCSLSDASCITAAAVAHHVLRRGEGAGARGEFTTLSNRGVGLSGGRLSAGAGFPAPRASAALLDSKAKHVELPGGASARLQLYYISQPLEGGIDAPASLDDVSEATLGELLGFLRMSPGAEGPLTRLKEQVELLAMACERGGASLRERAAELLGLDDWGGESGNGGNSGDSPAPREWEATPLAQALQHLLSAAAEDVLHECRELAALSSAGGAAGAALERHVLLCLQAECSRRLHAPLLALLRGVMGDECGRVGAALGVAAAAPPAALGLKPRYACDLSGALGALAAVARAPCPLTKLQALSAARAAMLACLEAHLRRGDRELSEEDFGADDELPLMTALLACAFAQGGGGGGGGGGDGEAGARAATVDLPLHLAFIQICHHPDAAPLQRSRLGYTLANWDLATRWEPPLPAEE
jgi:hypothetical protein